jgi:hypothetical protein
MIPEESFKQLDGGLYAAVVPYNKSDPMHRSFFGDALRDVISYEALVHHSPFNKKDFDKVLRALVSGDIEARFFMAAWELCSPKIVGATITVPTLSMEWDGRNLKANLAEHSEDVCLLPAAIKELIREKPEGRSLPGNGLADVFDRESIRQMKEEGKAARFGEFVLRNTKIKRILNQSGTVLGTEENSAILNLNNFTPAMRNLWLPNVDPNRIAFDIDGSDLCNKRIVTTWSDDSGAQRVAMSFTNSISTFKGGKPIIQAKFLDTDHLPPVASLKDILTSLIILGHEKASDLEWGVEQPKPQPSPVIPFDGSRREVLAALMSVGRDEMANRRQSRSFVFGGLPPETHFAVLDQPKIMAALTELDLPKRTLGPDETKPGVLPIEGASAKRPLFVVRKEAVENPCFALAA